MKSLEIKNPYNWNNFAINISVPYFLFVLYGLKGAFYKKGIYFMNKSTIYDNWILCMCIISMVSKQKSINEAISKNTNCKCFVIFFTHFCFYCFQVLKVHCNDTLKKLAAAFYYFTLKTN